MPNRVTPMHNLETHGRPCETYARSFFWLILRHVYHLSFRLKKFEYYELRVMFQRFMSSSLVTFCYLPPFAFAISSVTIKGHEGTAAGLTCFTVYSISSFNKKRRKRQNFGDWIFFSDKVDIMIEILIFINLRRTVAMMKQFRYIKLLTL